MNLRKKAANTRTIPTFTSSRSRNRYLKNNTSTATITTISRATKSAVAVWFLTVVPFQRSSAPWAAYRRVRVTRANGVRTPELSLSMCHCQESFARS